MGKYSLDADIKVKETINEEEELDEKEVDEWANAPEPEDMEEFDNLRLDKEAMARYKAIKKAHEQNSRARQGYHKY